MYLVLLQSGVTVENGSPQGPYCAVVWFIQRVGLLLKIEPYSEFVHAEIVPRVIDIVIEAVEEGDCLPIVCDSSVVVLRFEVIFVRIIVVDSIELVFCSSASVIGIGIMRLSIDILWEPDPFGLFTELVETQMCGLFWEPFTRTWTEHVAFEMCFIVEIVHLSDSCGHDIVYVSFLVCA